MNEVSRPGTPTPSALKLSHSTTFHGQLMTWCKGENRRSQGIWEHLPSRTLLWLRWFWEITGEQNASLTVQSPQHRSPLNISTLRHWRLCWVKRLPKWWHDDCSPYSVCGYSRITSTKSPSFFMTTFSASLTNLTALLPQSRDCSCYISRRVLAHPPLWLQKHTDLRAHGFAQPPDLWRQPRLANGTCAWSWRLCGLNLAVRVFICYAYQCALLTDCAILDAHAANMAHFRILEGK
jgi:hypothetical protein